MSSKQSIWVVETPVVIVMSWLFISREIVSFDSCQVHIGDECLPNFLSILQQYMNTIVMTNEVGNS